MIGVLTFLLLCILIAAAWINVDSVNADALDIDGGDDERSI
jgi:hypothetical protein